MSEKNRKNSGEKGNTNSIDQIDKLQLPKRKDRRRNIYLGEQVLCCLHFDELETHVNIIDLSSRGLAVVETQKKGSLPCVEGQEVFLEFKKGTNHPFRVKGIVGSVTQVTFNRIPYERIGIAFSIRACKNVDEYLNAVPDTIVPCRSVVRPQASCLDPFFFDELVLFQVNGFSPHGVDLLVSARCKTVLPHQPIAIDFYIPGRGRFLVDVNNSDIHFQNEKNSFRIFASYEKPQKRFLSAVSEYLVMFSEEENPVSLRSKGFTVADLDYAFDIQYNQKSDDFLKKEQMNAAMIAPPLENSSVSKVGLNSRTLSCKLGPNYVASMELVFVGGNIENSKLSKDHNIDKNIIKDHHIELCGLYMNDKVMLLDIFLPLMKNIIRIAVQAKCRYFLLESNAQLKSIVQKIGFYDLGSQTKRTDQDGISNDFYLIGLDVKKVLLNQDKYLPEAVWKKVYQDLFSFFKKQMKQNLKVEKKGARSS